MYYFPTNNNRIISVGSLNVCGCSSLGTEWKREEIGRLFESRGMDVLALSETKMKGRGEVMFGNVSGRKSGLLNVRANASEGVALIVKEELKEYVREWKEVSSRVMWVRMKFGADSWVFVSVYGPGSERSVKEKEVFWDELRTCVHRFRANEMVVVLGDLNVYFIQSYNFSIEILVNFQFLPALFLDPLTCFR